MATQRIKADQVEGGGGNPADTPPASPTAWDYEFEGSGTSVPSPFSIANFPGTTAYAESGGKGRIFYPSAQTAVQIIGMDQPITSDATWEYTAKLALHGVVVNYRELDIFMRDSVGGRVNSFSMDARGAAVKRWTAMTTWNSETFGYLPEGWPTGYPVYMRMKKVSSILWEGWFSLDGTDWVKVVSSDFSWMTTAPNKIGWGGSHSTAAHPDVYVDCEWFRRTA